MTLRYLVVIGFGFLVGLAPAHGKTVEELQRNPKEILSFIESTPAPGDTESLQAQAWFRQLFKSPRRMGDQIGDKGLAPEYRKFLVQQIFNWYSDSKFPTGDGRRTEKSKDYLLALFAAFREESQDTSFREHVYRLYIQQLFPLLDSEEKTSVVNSLRQYAAKNRPADSRAMAYPALILTEKLPNLIARLTELVQEPEVRVRRRTFEALAASRVVRQQALDPTVQGVLVQFLLDPDENVRLDARKSMEERNKGPTARGKLLSAQAITTLTWMLNIPDPDSADEVERLKALHHSIRLRALTEALHPGDLQGRPPSEQIAGLYTRAGELNVTRLLFFPRAAGLPPLARSQARRYAAQLLGWNFNEPFFSPLNQSENSAIFAGLRRQLVDPDANIRREAANAFASMKMRDPDSQLALIEVACHDADGGISLTAFSALGKTDKKEVVQSIVSETVKRKLIEKLRGLIDHEIPDRDGSRIESVTNLLKRNAPSDTESFLHLFNLYTRCPSDTAETLRAKQTLWSLLSTEQDLTIPFPTGPDAADAGQAYADLQTSTVPRILDLVARNPTENLYRFGVYTIRQLQPTPETLLNLFYRGNAQERRFLAYCFNDMGKDRLKALIRAANADPVLSPAIALTEPDPQVRLYLLDAIKRREPNLADRPRILEAIIETIHDEILQGEIHQEGPLALDVLQQMANVRNRWKWIDVEDDRVTPALLALIDEAIAHPGNQFCIQAGTAANTIIGEIAKAKPYKNHCALALITEWAENRQIQRPRQTPEERAEEVRRLQQALQRQSWGRANPGQSE